ncbi:MAG: PrsW family intramembrane metalloprotease [Anaerolineae bacterium]|nr:PrsW family intramembrane metalloprotease [Anaerolineae bacterium]
MEEMFALATSFLLGFIPLIFFAVIIYWLDRYEKEPVLLLGGVFIWGAVVAAAGAFLINSFSDVSIAAVSNSESLANFTTDFMIAPVVEETLKGFAVFLVFLMFRSEFDSILDGIVYAAITALGFAATENVFYIYTYGFMQGGWEKLFLVAFLRDVVVGWQHPFYTAFIGIGLAYARLHRQSVIQLFAVLIGWSLSVFTHSMHNLLASYDGIICIVGSVLDWSGWLAMLVFILLMANREKKLIQKYLLEESSLGTISELQYLIAQSTRLRTSALLRSLFRGNFSATRHFYQTCAELTHKKFQYERMGDESGNSEIINQLRCELSLLSSQVST